jgi:hypothetical protein
VKNLIIALAIVFTSLFVAQPVLAQNYVQGTCYTRQYCEYTPLGNYICWMRTWCCTTVWNAWSGMYVQECAWR